MHHNVRSAATLLSLALLASCSGAGGSATPPARHSAASTALWAQTLVRVRVPGAAEFAAARRSQYVSRATQGLGISYRASGTSAPAFPAIALPNIAVDISASSPACIADTNGLGGRSCSLTIPAPAGSDDFQVTAWDAVPANGSFGGSNRLSGTTVLGQTITLGQQNTLALTLDGVVMNIFVAVAPKSLVAQPASGPAQTALVSVNATDPDGNIILGTGSYTDANGNPITVTLTQSGINGGSVLTTFQNQPSSTGPLTITPQTGSLTVSYPGGSTQGTIFTATTSAPIGGITTPGTLTIQ